MAEDGKDSTALLLREGHDIKCGENVGDEEHRCGGKGGERWKTCLMTAAYNGHLAICRLLIDKGAQLEAKDSGGWTPLHYAAFRGHVEIVRLLCDRGADVEARDNGGWRPLHYAAIMATSLS
jgi:hypothetical protein